MTDPSTLAIVVHELLGFMPAERILVLGRPGQLPAMRHALDGWVPDTNLVVGGDDAHASLHTALQWFSDCSPQLSADTTVVIAEPATSAESLTLVIDTSRVHDHAPVVPVLPMTETVKQLDEDGWIVATVPREHLVQVQRPQAAALGALQTRHAGCDPQAVPPLLNLVGTSTDTLLVPGRTHVRA